MGNFLAVIFCLHFIVSYDFSIPFAVLLKHKTSNILLHIHGHIRLLSSTVSLQGSQLQYLPFSSVFHHIFFSLLSAFCSSVSSLGLAGLSRALGDALSSPTFAPRHVLFFSELCGKFLVPASGTCPVGRPGRAVFSETFNAYYLRFTLRGS